MFVCYKCYNQNFKSEALPSSKNWNATPGGNHSSSISTPSHHPSSFILARLLPAFSSCVVALSKVLTSASNLSSISTTSHHPSSFNYARLACLCSWVTSLGKSLYLYKPLQLHLDSFTSSQQFQLGKTCLPLVPG